PLLPATSTAVGRPLAARSSATARRCSSRSRPTKRALVNPGAIAAFYESESVGIRLRANNAGRRRCRGAPVAPPVSRLATLERVTAAPRAPHPENTLNELSGEEWLYFTKSAWSTAYPSELGHDLRRAHGANKPPRLMARLIEFFTKGGELVLDPFAGVGGTLLGAAIARPPRRALGFEIERRWAAIYEEVVRAAGAQASHGGNGHGPLLRDLGDADPGGTRTFDPSGCEMLVGDAVVLLGHLADESVDFVATDPPYNVQLPRTMAGGPLAVSHANRRTDYAMVSAEPGDIANAAGYDEYLARMGTVL